MRPNFIVLLLLSFLAASTTALAADADAVLVSEGAFKVTVQDIDAFIARIPQPDRAGLMDNPSRVNQVIMDLLHSKILAAQSRDLKLDQEPAIKQQIALATDEVLARARIDAYMKGIKVGDMTELAKEEYLVHKADFTSKAMVDVQHVLIKPGDDRSDEQAKALAEDSRKRALANPAGFGALVEQYSDDASKRENNGVIKDATRPAFAPPFRAAAEALQKKDEISPVVKTRFGYHVIKLVEFKPAITKTFDAVKDQLITKLQLQYLNKQKGDFITKLDSEKLDVNAALVDSLRTRYLSPGQLNPREASQASGADAPAAGQVPPKQ